MKRNSCPYRPWIGWAILCTAMVAVQASSQLSLPPQERHQLPNGMTLILMEQHELPIVSLNFVIRAGSITDPVGKEGVASLTAGLLRQGTESRSADQISAQLDFIGAQFSVSAGLESTQGSAEFLSKDVTAGLGLLADILRHPSFPPEEVNKRIQQRIGGIQSAKEMPGAVMGRYFYSFLYGRHPYHRPVGGDENSLAAIQRQDVLDFYRHHYRPANTILAVAGDFDSRQMKTLLQARFGSWSGGKPAKAAVAKKPRVKGRRLLLVDKPDSTQTFFTIGNIGVHRRHPDRVALRVVNTLFGGRFTSMLNSRLRVESGLTYGASSWFDNYLQPGAFRIYTYTPTETTEEAIDMALDILRNLHEKGVDEELLTSAKNYIKGQYPPSIETSDQLARLLTELEFYGLDRNEVDQFYSKVDALTVEQAAEVIRRHFPLEDLVFTVIGKADEIEGVVKKYSEKVERKSISETGF